MKYKYKRHDKVELKRKSSTFDHFTGVRDVVIKKVDKDDHTLPYLISFRADGNKTKLTRWVAQREIKCLWSVIRVGGE